MSGCEGDLTFQWILFECPYETSQWCTKVEEAELVKMINTKPDMMFYGANPFAYKPNVWYDVRFRGYRTVDVYGESSFRFYTNSNPESGEI